MLNRSTYCHVKQMSANVKPNTMSCTPRSSRRCARPLHEALDACLSTWSSSPRLSAMHAIDEMALAGSRMMGLDWSSSSSSSTPQMTQRGVTTHFVSQCLCVQARPELRTNDENYAAATNDGVTQHCYSPTWWQQLQRTSLGMPPDAHCAVKRSGVTRHCDHCHRFHLHLARRLSSVPLSRLYERGLYM